MKIGIMSDIHDNVDNLRHAINLFNYLQVRAVLLAGDFVSPLVVPSMRKLTCPVISCFGDNDGNQTGILGGMKIIGTVGFGAICWRSPDGVHFLMAHQLEDIRNCIDGADVVIFAHTHRSSVAKDRHGRLFVNPGEVGGWMFRKPTVAVVDTETREAEILSLPEMSPGVFIPEPG
ncbi:MAG: YfcE family phosphodiesterase [Planctomycetaceae bacterium]|nr:YfcE family phosphodiesterase [Planctomycetaceae bacterium]